MNVGVLFSGGKDSCYALFKAMQEKESMVVCLISIISRNPESFMFHTPNIWVTELQAQAIGLPLVKQETAGVKEEELKDLKKAIEKAKKKFKLEGIVTGAIESVYQSQRIQKICSELNLKCINPLWKKSQKQLLEELLENNFKVIISGIFAFPLNEKWLGRELDEWTVKELVGLQEKFKLSPSGEGGEIETTVLDTPFFKKRIEVIESEIKVKHNSGVFIIKKARLKEK
ncbi:MAG: diphthine--ammonia ligase [Candidatus Diapherotrites archaeon]